MGVCGLVHLRIYTDVMADQWFVEFPHGDRCPPRI